MSRAVLNKERNKLTGEDFYYILVEGLGLEKVMGTNGVDGRQTVTNHIMETQRVLGKCLYLLSCIHAWRFYNSYTNEKLFIKYERIQFDINLALMIYIIINNFLHHDHPLYICNVLLVILTRYRSSSIDDIL